MVMGLKLSTDGVSTGVSSSKSFTSRHLGHSNCPSRSPANVSCSSAVVVLWAFQEEGVKMNKERVLSKALPSYTYEVTFGTGALGINLQTTKSKKGAYVDTFFRPKDNSILPAEQSGYIKLGDLIIAINDEDVSQQSLRDIPRIIERASRPITIKFERIVMELEFLDVVNDPRKLPWYMHYIAEKHSEEANIEQAKLMLWLEVEQCIESQLDVPDGNYTDQAHRILRKFFRPDSKFSLIVHVPNTVRQAMLTALALAEAGDEDSKRYDTSLQSYQIFRDAQGWAAEDLQAGSFSKFCSSRMCARMCGHLRNSPPFVKMSLRDILDCDKKTIFLLVHLCHLKRHSVLHCYNLLKHRPEDNVEGGTGAIEDMLKVAMACVHILGLKKASHGIEDLPMLTRLTELLPSTVELSNHLSISVSSNRTASTRSATYFDKLQNAITTSIPFCDDLVVLTRDTKKMNEIRECIRALRTRIMRELSTEIMPAFLASAECEVLLWELDSRRLYLLSERKKRQENNDNPEADEASSVSSLDIPDTPPRKSHEHDRDDLELVRTLRHGGSKDMLDPSTPQKKSSEDDLLVVPDGAVQRLLRQTELPGSMTMHRAPLDMLEDISREQKEMEGDPVSLLLAFDTEGGNIVDNRSPRKKNRSLAVSREYPEHLQNIEDDPDSDDENNIICDDPIEYVSSDDTHIETELFSETPEKNHEEASKPEDVAVKFVHPVGSNVADTKFNMRYLSQIPDSINNFLIPDGRCIFDTPTKPKLFNFAVNLPNNSLVYGCCLLMFREVKMKIPVVVKPKSSPMHTTIKDSSSKVEHSTRKQVPQTPRAPPPNTPMSSFKALTSSSETPLKSPANMGEWIGQVSLSSVKSSPFIDKFRGLGLRATPTNGRTPLPTAKHSRGGGSDDLSSDLNTEVGIADSERRRSAATIHKVEETYAKAKLLLEHNGGVSERDSAEQSTPPPETASKERVVKKVLSNSALLSSPTHSFKASCANPQYYSPNSSFDSRDDVVVPMFAAHGFCLLSSVAAVNALRHPLSALASDDRLKTILESTHHGGFSDLELSEDDFQYEYSDDDSIVRGTGEEMPSESEEPSTIFEKNPKTRTLRALNFMETDRTLQNLRKLHCDMSATLKLPAVLRHGGAQDYNAEMILRTLSPKNFVTVFLAFLLEFKIAVVSSKVTALLVLGEFLKVLISPLKWSHVYCPLLPKQFSNDLLQCPTPFYVGIQREFADLSDVPPNVIVLDIEKNTCTVTEDLASCLSVGRKLTKKLSSLLLPSLDHCDSLTPPAVEANSFASNDMTTIHCANDTVVREVLRHCKVFISDLLLGVDECCTFGVDHDEAVVLFDEAMFISSRAARNESSMLSLDELSNSSADNKFLSHFLRTQCFSLCIIGTILKKLGPDSRPPSRPSSPYISIPSPTLFPSTSSVGMTPNVQLPNTPVERS